MPAVDAVQIVLVVFAVFGRDGEVVDRAAVPPHADTEHGRVVDDPPQFPDPVRLVALRCRRGSVYIFSGLGAQNPLAPCRRWPLLLHKIRVQPEDGQEHGVELESDLGDGGIEIGRQRLHAFWCGVLRDDISECSCTGKSCQRLVGQLSYDMEKLLRHTVVPRILIQTTFEYLQDHFLLLVRTKVNTHEHMLS